MSEAIRSYRPSRGANYDGPGRRRGPLRWLVTPIIVLGLLWLLWTTRDSHSVSEVIPQDQSFHFQVRDLLSTREEIAQSAIWGTGLVPEHYAEIPAMIGNSFGLPDWVLNNLISDTCYISGTDLMTFEDLIVVTRMSRIGCLLERYHGFIDLIDDEYAGGLALRKLGESDFYYAVRGRTLVFSPSRDAIVRALTLRESDAITSLETAGLGASGDLRGRMAFSDDEPLGHYFEQSDCHFSIAPNAITFSSKSTLKKDWRAPMDALGFTAPSDSFLVPDHGGVVLVGDFGVPLARIWSAANEMAAGGLNDFMAQWKFLERLEASEREAFWATFGQLSGSLGSEFLLRSVGFDVDGIVPMPMVSLSLQPDFGALNAVLDAVPASPAGVLPPNGLPYQSANDGLLHVPLGWGNIIEPSAFIQEPQVHIALHPIHLLESENLDAARVPAPGTGHVFLRVRPGELLETLADGVLLYTDQNMLHGQGAATLRAALGEANVIAERVPELSVTMTYLDGELLVELRLELTVAAE